MVSFALDPVLVIAIEVDWHCTKMSTKRCETLEIAKLIVHSIERTSDGGNRNHSVSLPIILIKIKINQMLQFS